jgi:pilus assembly protein CpaB
MKNILGGIGKNKPLIMIGIAIVIALVVSGMVYSWLKKARDLQQTAYSLGTQPVAVAQVDLQWGTILSKEMVKPVLYLKEGTPPGYFSDPSAVVGRTVIYPMKANEPILESRLAPTSVKTGGVAAIITPKKRAMAVKVDKVVGVSGFVHPGNRVDVLVTLTQAGAGKDESTITKIILENMLVLATGSEIEQGSKQEKPQSADVITLEVTPEEGEKLAQATTQGKIQLALRNFADTEDVNTRGSTNPNLLASYSGGPYKQKEVAKSKVKAVRQASSVREIPASFTVETINGNRVSEKKFFYGSKDYEN